ncbi:hypothetical protein M8J75_011448 [Diaphorina citri]|nr:hypothetical protein M8J75_011448 [Diaphorina citri]
MSTKQRASVPNQGKHQVCPKPSSRNYDGVPVMKPTDVSTEKTSRKRKHSDKTTRTPDDSPVTECHDSSPVKIRREHASTFVASEDIAVKRKLDILKRSTLRPIVIYYEPKDAKLPSQYKWRLYPFKNHQPLPIMYIHRQSAYIIGRNAKVSDILIRHCSCSNQHAVLQYRELSLNNTRVVRPYLMDLKSMNGTFVNGMKIAPLTYVELFEGDVIEFGLSTREYVLLHQNSECLQRNVT